MENLKKIGKNREFAKFAKNGKFAKMAKNRKFAKNGKFAEICKFQEKTRKKSEKNLHLVHKKLFLNKRIVQFRVCVGDFMVVDE